MPCEQIEHLKRVDPRYCIEFILGNIYYILYIYKLYPVLWEYHIAIVRIIIATTGTIEYYNSFGCHCSC